MRVLKHLSLKEMKSLAAYYRLDAGMREVILHELTCRAQEAEPAEALRERAA